ncbi:MAG: hypothetical protein AAGC55_24820, partial [Myxococcota bacterium]
MRIEGALLPRWGQKYSITLFRTGIPGQPLQPQPTRLQQDGARLVEQGDIAHAFVVAAQAPPQVSPHLGTWTTVNDQLIEPDRYEWTDDIGVAQESELKDLKCRVEKCRMGQIAASVGRQFIGESQFGEGLIMT